MGGAFFLLQGLPGGRFLVRRRFLASGINAFNRLHPFYGDDLIGRQLSVLSSFFLPIRGRSEQENRKKREAVE